VLVAAGTYADQTITPDRAKTSSVDVVFRPVAGARVDVGGSGLTVFGSHIEFRDLRTSGGWYAKPGADDLTFRRIRSKDFFISSGSNIRVLGGSVGPGVDYHPIIGADDAVPPRNILIDGVRFHDWTRSSDSVHIECLQIAAGDGVTVQRSRFENCDVMNVHVTHWGETPLTRNVTLENNFFGEAGGGYYAIQANAFENLLIRNNSLLQPIVIFTEQGPGTNVRVVGNVGPMQQSGCENRVVYRHNVWTNARCDPTDRRAPSGFRDPAGLDLRLKLGSAAIDRGDPTSYPAADIDGERRPKGRAPDAGADELG
jgi:hypothetical protein